MTSTGSLRRPLAERDVKSGARPIRARRVIRLPMTMMLTAQRRSHENYLGQKVSVHLPSLVIDE